MVDVTLKMLVVCQYKKPGYMQKMPKPGLLKKESIAILRCQALAVTGTGNPLSTLRFALLAASEFARLFVALLELQPLEKAVVLNFFLQNTHGFFEIVIEYFNFDFLQIYRPFLNIRGR
ncbi:hypothetical protein DBB_580 [Desulfoluna spongiiphila]|nr:hypothetical protein DBB_580 [Desulfoluna spongiiphila]